MPTPRPPLPPEELANLITAEYHRLDELDHIQECARALLTDQRSRGVNIFGQTVAMAELMSAINDRIPEEEEEFIPDWVIATFGLEECWEGLAEVQAAKDARLPLQEAWAPGPGLRAAVQRGDEELFVGAVAPVPPVSSWGLDAGEAYDELLAGVLPGVEEEAGGGGGGGGGGGALPGGGE